MVIFYVFLRFFRISFLTFNKWLFENVFVFQRKLFYLVSKSTVFLIYYFDNIKLRSAAHMLNYVIENPVNSERLT